MRLTYGNIAVAAFVSSQKKGKSEGGARTGPDRLLTTLAASPIKTSTKLQISGIVGLEILFQLWLPFFLFCLLFGLCSAGNVCAYLNS